MANAKQLRLPKLKGVERIKKIRKLPQPHVSRFRIIKKYEIIHRPFDLKFRGRIHKWLIQLSNVGEFKLTNVFDNKNARIVKLYFFPQKPDNRWLNQREVLEKVNRKSIKKLRTALVSSLLQIWKLHK